MLEMLRAGQSVEFKYEGVTLRGVVETIRSSRVVIARRDFRSYKRSIRNRWHPPDRANVPIEDILRIEKGPA